MRRKNKTGCKKAECHLAARLTWPHENTHVPRNNPKKFCSCAHYACEREKSLAKVTEEGPRTRCGSTGSSAGSSNPRSGDRHNKSSRHRSSPASIITHHFEFRCEQRP